MDTALPLDWDTSVASAVILVGIPAFVQLASILWRRPRPPAADPQQQERRNDADDEAAAASRGPRDFQEALEAARLSRRIWGLSLHDMQQESDAESLSLAGGAATGAAAAAAAAQQGKLARQRGGRSRAGGGDTSHAAVAGEEGEAAVDEAVDEAAAAPPNPGSVAALYRSPAFQRHVRRRGLNLERAARRLEVFRDLRDFDPRSFEALWAAAGAPAAGVRRHESGPLPAWALALDFALQQSAYACLIAAAFLMPWDQQVRRHTLHAAGVWALANMLTLLLSCGSTLPALALTRGQAVYEDSRWCTPPGALRVATAIAVDVAYGLATLGLGLPVTLGMRALGRRGQSLGERLLRVRLVREWSEPLAGSSSEPDGW